MARKFLVFATFFLAAIFQTSIAPNFFSAGALPDLMLIAVVFWTARYGFGKTWRLAVLAGFLSDIFSFSPVGMSIISFMAAAWATGFLARRFLITHMAWRFFILVILVIVATVINDLSLALFWEVYAQFNGLPGPSLAFFDRTFGLKIFYNALVFALAYWPLKKLEKVKNYYNQRTELRSYVR